MSAFDACMHSKLPFNSFAHDLFLLRHEVLVKISCDSFGIELTARVSCCLIVHLFTRKEIGNTHEQQQQKFMKLSLKIDDMRCQSIYSMYVLLV